VAFGSQDAPAGMRVAVVNDLLADHLWPGRDPTGALLWIDAVAYQIVGVTAGYATTPLRRPRPTFYLPIAQQASDLKRLHFLVRTKNDPASLVTPVRRGILGLGSGEIVAAVFTLDQVVAGAGREVLSATYPMVPLIATGMLLTAAGIYGVLAFAMTRRSHELAVRVAVGATQADLVRLVTVQSLRLVSLGTVLSVGATYALTRVAQGNGGVFDSPGWQAFALPLLIVALIGVLATWIPCRRALNINPVVLLRTL